MKKSKFFAVTALVFIAATSCSNKGDGKMFYIEVTESHYIVHSKLDCKAIKGGVAKYKPGEVDSGQLMCSKCMDNELYDIAINGISDDEDEDDDF